MKRNTVHLLLDVLLAINGLAMVCTGLLMWLVLPAHSRQNTVWTMTRHDWGELHTYLALSLISLVAIHLMLNWAWVCAVAGNVLTRAHISVTGTMKTISGAAMILLIAAIVCGFLWAATANVVKAEDGGGGQHRGWRSDQTESVYLFSIIETADERGYTRIQDRARQFEQEVAEEAEVRRISPLPLLPPVPFASMS